MTRLVVQTETLSYSINELYIYAQEADVSIFSQETREELFVWQKTIEEVFKTFQDGSSTFSFEKMEQKLNHHFLSIEKHLSKGLNKEAYDKINKKEKESLFKLLAGFQDVSIALIAYSQTSESTNWQELKEEVFA